MANDVNVKGRISIDTGDSVQQVSNVKKGLNEVSATAKDSHSNFTNLKESLSNLAPGLKNSSEGVGTLNTAFKALLANPIVLAIAAIVAALVGLYKAFTSTLDGAQKMEQVFEGLKAVMTVITDRLVSFGNAVIKVFSGDIKGAMVDAKASVNGLSDAIGEAYTKTVDITKKLQAIRKDERVDALDKSAREKRLALLREQLNDESVSVKQKIAIAKELRDDQIKNAEDDKARTIAKSDLEIAKIKLKKNLTEEDLNEINKLEIEKNKVETENALEGIRTNKVIRNLQKQDAAERKAEIEAEKRAREELKKQLEEERKLRIKMRQDASDGIITVAQLKAEELRMEQERDAKLKKIDDERLARQKASLEFNMGSANALLAQGAEMTRKSEENTRLEIDRSNQRINAYQAVGNALGSLSRLIGEQTAVGKGLALAEASINSYLAGSRALAAIRTAKSPIEALAGIATMVAVVASGLNNAKQILKVNIPGQSGGGGNIPSIAPLQPQLLQTSTSLNQSSINGLTNAAQGGTARVFVLEQDITNSQERAARITRAARLG